MTRYFIWSGCGASQSDFSDPSWGPEHCDGINTVIAQENPFDARSNFPGQFLAQKGTRFTWVTPVLTQDGRHGENGQFEQRVLLVRVHPQQPLRSLV